MIETHLEITELGTIVGDGITSVLGTHVGTDVVGIITMLGWCGTVITGTDDGTKTVGT